jgi:transcription elongation GreA/GreB family factor
MVDGSNDLDKGHVSVSSPLGKAVLGAEDGDEVLFRLDDGRERKVLIESVEKGPRVSAGTTIEAANAV